MNKRGAIVMFAAAAAGAGLGYVNYDLRANDKKSTVIILDALVGFVAMMGVALRSLEVNEEGRCRLASGVTVGAALGAGVGAAINLLDVPSKNNLNIFFFCVVGAAVAALYALMMTREKEADAACTLLREGS